MLSELSGGTNWKTLDFSSHLEFSVGTVFHGIERGRCKGSYDMSLRVLRRSSEASCA